MELAKWRDGSECANLALVAHKSRRVANDWLSKSASRANGITTGTGLSVFTWALNACVENISWIKSHGIETIMISTNSDSRRLSAYRKLLKRYKLNVDLYPWVTDEGEEFMAIHI
jgi:hypothetical protein